jgi:hypothetical protein
MVVSKVVLMVGTRDVSTVAWKASSMVVKMAEMMDA